MPFKRGLDPALRWHDRRGVRQRRAFRGPEGFVDYATASCPSSRVAAPGPCSMSVEPPKCAVVLLDPQEGVGTRWSCEGSPRRRMERRVVCPLRPFLSVPVVIGGRSALGRDRTTLAQAKALKFTLIITQIRRPPLGVCSVKGCWTAVSVVLLVYCNLLLGAKNPGRPQPLVLP